MTERPKTRRPQWAATITSGTVDIPTTSAPIVYTEDNGNSSATNGFLAVTGSYGVGTSVLYLVDTKTRQLAVYEARGGSAGQRRIVLVGARRIDLDLQLPSYNDRSEDEYDDPKRLFERNWPARTTSTSPISPPHSIWTLCSS